MSKLHQRRQVSTLIAAIEPQPGDRFDVARSLCLDYLWTLDDRLLDEIARDIRRAA